VRDVEEDRGRKSHLLGNGSDLFDQGLVWNFTRQRNPPETLVKEVRTIAKQMGFSTSVLFNVTHDSNCNVPGIDDKESITILGQNNVRFLRH
jgi:hypothetical protein